MVCDLLDAKKTAETIRGLDPDIMINAQALSDVDRCEREPLLAARMNVQTVAHLVGALQGARTRLIHMSTNYVFDGTKGAAYNEADHPNPISVYGSSKWKSEQVALSYPGSVVVRTGTLFGAGRRNFCDEVVSRLQAGQSLEAFVDQVISPTYTEDLAISIGALCSALSRSEGAHEPRIFHLVNGGACSRVMFAERIADLLGCSRALVRKIRMAEQPHPAARPAYSALTTLHATHVIGRTLRPWDDALQAYLRQRHWLN